MSFEAFRSNYISRDSRQLVQTATSLRRRLADQRQFDAIQAPTLCGTDAALSLLQTSYPSSVCLISRPLCGLYEPALGGCPQRYGNVPFTVDGAGGGCASGGCASGGCGSASFNYNYYGRGGAGGWQQIGYLLPLHVKCERRGGRRCTCVAPTSGPVTVTRRALKQPSQFGRAAQEPIDDYAHDRDCPLFEEDSEYVNREFGARRYHLYVRVNPDRFGQQCVYTSARRGDHRSTNCRYLQFGVSEEGVQDSAILLINSDYFADIGRNRTFNHATRCILDGDILFVPSEGRRKFRVTLYNDQIYNDNC